MPDTITVVIITASLLVAGLGQVYLFKILTLTLRGFIKAIIGSMFVSVIAFILGLLWTFGPLLTTIITLYALSSITIPLAAYVHRASILVDKEALINTLDQTIREVDTNARTHNFR